LVDLHRALSAIIAEMNAAQHRATVEPQAQLLN
jgi:hypothetical protein